MSAERKRLSTPLVLALTSGMVCVGIAGLVLGTGEPTPEEPEAEAGAVLVDQSTPERVAESFLDAWRKREHDAALTIALGDARDRVLERRARDASMTPHERELKQQVWDQMAADRLRLLIDASEMHEDGTMGLSGLATGTFLGRPYEREMFFTVAPDGEQWKVVDFDFGDILTEPPRLPSPEELAAPGAPTETAGDEEAVPE